MKLSSLQTLVESFEHHLGSPWKAGRLMNFKCSLEFDERETLTTRENAKNLLQ